MIGKIMIGKKATACISYGLKDHKIRNTLAFEFNVQRIKGLPVMRCLNFSARYNFVFIYLQKSIKLFNSLQLTTQEIFICLRNCSKLFETFQFSFNNLQESSFLFLRL
jgi:hypothetical protein